MIDRIKQILRSNDFKIKSVADFARKIGIEQTTTNNYILGKRKMSLDFVCSILNAFPQINAEWLMRGRGEMLAVETPQETNHDYAHICKQMADMYAEIQKLQAENAVLKAKRGEAVA